MAKYLVRLERVVEQQGMVVVEADSEEEAYERAPLPELWKDIAVHEIEHVGATRIQDYVEDGV